MNWKRYNSDLEFFIYIDYRNDGILEFLKIVSKPELRESENS